MEQRKVILTRGIQGSGKSTWAKAWTKEQPECRIRFNNDDIRNMFGEYWVPNRESEVTYIVDSIFYRAMSRGYDIVIDNMNLNSKETVRFQSMIDRNNKETDDYFYTLEYKDFFIPVEECIRRDARRLNPIGEKVIKETWKRYRNFINAKNIQNVIDKKAPHIDGAQFACIIDIDGTLSLNTTGRPYYGGGAAKGMLNDEPVTGVIELVQSMYNQGFRCLIVTGREDSEDVKDATEKWLNKYQVPYDQIFYRSKGSYISAEWCKEVIYNTEIKGKYNILFVVEDNDKCVKMWRELGLTCLQPNEGNL